MIVDDEPLGRERLTTLIAGEGDLELVGACGSAVEALAVLRAERVDVVFLDIEMPGLDGFELVDALPAVTRPHVVFVTAHEAHAVRAFGVRALDYLLKPFDRLRFADTLARIREATRDSPAPAQRLAVKNRAGAIVFLKLDEVDWIEAAGNYVEVHVGASSYLMRATLAQLEATLPRALFARVHRRAIANLEAIVELRPGVGDDALLIVRSRAEVPLGRSFRGSLEARLSLVR